MDRSVTEPYRNRSETEFVESGYRSLGIVLRFELYCFPSARQNERFNHGLLGLKPVDDAVDNDG